MKGVRDASSPQEGNEMARRAIADVHNQSLVANVQLPKLKSRESVIGKPLVVWVKRLVEGHFFQVQTQVFDGIDDGICNNDLLWMKRTVYVANR